MNEHGEKRQRFHQRGVTIHDEAQPGNPAVALVERFEHGETKLIAVRLPCFVLVGEREVSVLSPRCALELAAALIQISIGQRFTLPEGMEIEPPKPNCSVCGSEADLDATGRCPEHRERAP